VTKLSGEETITLVASSVGAILVLFPEDVPILTGIGILLALATVGYVAYKIV
jgi:hypothetical protein